MSSRRFICAVLTSVLLLGTRVFGADDAPLRETTRGAFLIQADFDLAELEPELRELDRLVVELRRALRLPPMKDRVAVRIFPDEASWREFYRKKFAPAAYREAIYERTNYLLDRSGIKGRVYLHRNKYFLEDLRHECSHAVLGATLGSVPIWLDEGVAEYFEAAPDERLHNPEWSARLRKRIETNEFLPIEKLEKLSGVSDMTSVKYCDSWAWVCFMLNDSRETNDALCEYLADVGAKKIFAPKMSKRLAKLFAPERPDARLRRFYRALDRASNARQRAGESGAAPTSP